ncbi:MAG: ribosome silencing factor [Cardiobacteriaceae bacterium]|nr:ribosome silencing factor [Cardiobacteriaceae bacterium]
MDTNQLKHIVQNSLEDLKAVDIQCIDLAGKTDIADYMIVASGTSDRHLHALAGKIHDDCKAAGYLPLGIEGEDSRDWVLVDLGDIIVHIMRPETRELYALEKLWSLPPTRN